MNRRSLLLAAAGGVTVGAGWGYGVGYALRHHEPYVDVIGRGTSQLVLVDTAAARVLVVTGTGSSATSLFERLPFLLGTFRRRLDVLAGERGTLAALGSHIDGRYDVQRQIVVDDESSPAASIVELGGGLTMAFYGTTAEMEPWRVELRHHSGTIAVGNELAVPGSVLPAIAVVPDLHAGSGSRLAVTLAVNTDNVPAGGAAVATDENDPWLVRIYDETIARFRFGDPGIHLPTWAKRHHFDAT